MNLHLVARLRVTATLLLSLAVPAATEETYTPLLNGNDLSGWKAEGNARWQMRDGVLIERQGPNKEAGVAIAWWSATVIITSEKSPPAWGSWRSSNRASMTAVTHPSERNSRRRFCRRTFERPRASKS